MNLVGSFGFFMVVFHESDMSHCLLCPCIVSRKHLIMVGVDMGIASIFEIVLKLLLTDLNVFDSLNSCLGGMMC